MNRPSLYVVSLAVAVVSAAIAPRAFPQPDRSPPRAPGGAATQPVNPTVEFGERALQMETLGLTMQVPVGATSQVTSAGKVESGQIIAPDDAWIITIDSTSLPPDGEKETPGADRRAGLDKLADQALGIISEPLEEGGARGRLLSREDDLRIGALKARRFYVQFPGVGAEPALVRGYTVVEPRPGVYVGFDLRTTADDFARVRVIFETTLATAAFVDPATAIEDRVKAVNAGVRVAATWDEQTLREVAAETPERWERLFVPGPTGAPADDTEVGYRRIRVWLGGRDELDQARDGGTVRGGESRGVLVRMDARVLDRGRVIDSQSVFFLSFDKQDEAWSVRNAVREGEERAVIGETGARAGSSMQVQVRGTGVMEGTVRPTVPPTGYISRVETVLLPRLLVRAGVPGEFGFYAYETQTNTISIRRDSVDQPADRPGVWVITTRLGEEGRAQTATLDERGGLVRIDLPDGKRWEPTSPDALMRLWREKGLPLD